MRQLRLFVFTYLLFSNLALAQLPRDAFGDLQKLTLQIFSVYSPKEYCFIGIGSSPSPLIALFQSLGLSATSFPFSRNSVSANLKQIDPKSDIALRIIKHFQHFIPSQTDSESICYNKKLLFIDFAYTGRSITEFEKSLIFSSKNVSSLISSEPHYLALTGKYFPNNKTISNSLNSIVLGRHLFEMMNAAEFDSAREYEKWNSIQNKYSFATRSEYKIFKNKIKEQLENNQKFYLKLKASLESGEFKFSFCEKLLYILGY